MENTEWMRGRRDEGDGGEIEGEEEGVAGRKRRGGEGESGKK